MIKLSIGKGFLVITDGNGQVYPGWVGDTLPSYPGLPEPDDVYRRCQVKGLSPEQTIDIMLNVFHRQRLIRSSFLADIPLVIGLIGGAGAGKSCGGAGIAIYDYLLAGVPVISNMELQTTVRFKDAGKVFKSESLDKISILDVQHLEQMYRNVCVFVDEANIEFSEARRSMSNRNLKFNYLLQERRKRKLNLIHTEQSETWVDDRLRFATDLFIKCKDAAYDDGMPRVGELGRRSHWKIYDYSGVILGDVPDTRDPRAVVYDGTFHNTPFWHSFDTYQIQGLEDNSATSNDVSIRDGATLGKLKEKYTEGRQVVEQLLARGVKTIETKELWKAIGIENNRSMQTKIGAQLAGLGIPVVEVNGKRGYIIDSEAENIK